MLSPTTNIDTPSRRMESIKDAIVAVVPLTIRQRNIFAALIFVALILMALHLVAIDTSADTNANGIISPLEASFEFKKISGMAWLDYALSALILSYSACIPFAIWADDI